MSSKAFKLSKEDLNEYSSKEVSFSYTHSDIADLLSFVRNLCEMPFDNGGMGVPLVIYRFELEEMLAIG